MSEQSYEEMLNESMDDIQEPQLLPTGSYLMRIAGFNPRPGKDGKKATILVIFSPVKAMEDVDDEALEELGADYDIGISRVSHTVWYGDASERASAKRTFRLFGINPEGKTLAEVKELAKDAMVVGNTVHETYTDKNSGELVTKSKIVGFAPAE